MFPLGRCCASLPCESQMGEALGAKVSWRLCGEVQRYWGLWGYQSVCQVCGLWFMFSEVLSDSILQYQPQKTWLECWSSQKIQPINHEHFCHLSSPDQQNWGLDMFSHALHGLLGQKGPVNVGDWPSLEHLICLLGIQFSRAHGPMKHSFFWSKNSKLHLSSASWRPALDRPLRNYTNFGVFELYSVSSSRKCHFICLQPLLQEIWLMVAHKGTNSLCSL